MEGALTTLPWARLSTERLHVTSLEGGHPSCFTADGRIGHAREGGRDIELRQLRSFVAVVEGGGFARAAHRLFLSPPAVTAHV